MKLHLPIFYRSRGSWHVAAKAIEIREYFLDEAPVALRTRMVGEYGDLPTEYRAMGGRIYRQSSYDPIGATKWNAFKARFGSKDAAIRSAMNGPRADSCMHPFMECYAKQDLHGLTGTRTALPTPDETEVEASPMARVIDDIAARTILISGSFHTESVGPILTASNWRKNLSILPLSTEPTDLLASWSIDDEEAATEFCRRRGIPHDRHRVERLRDVKTFDPSDLALEALAFVTIHHLRLARVAEADPQIVGFYAALRETLENAWSGKPTPDNGFLHWPHYGFSREATALEAVRELLMRVPFRSDSAWTRMGMELAKQRDFGLGKRPSGAMLKDLEGFKI